MERSFSRFIVSVLVVFEAVSLALIVGVLYGILSRSITSDFYNQIKAEGVEISMALQDRIAQLNTRLREMSLNNTIRVSLMLGLENQLVEVMMRQYPYSDGAFYCLRGAEFPEMFPVLPEGLKPLKQEMERLAKKEKSHFIRFHEPGGGGYVTLMSVPIMRKEERLGTAFVWYNLFKDDCFWEHVRVSGRPKLLAQSGQGWTDLRTGRDIHVSGNIRTTVKGGTGEVQIDRLPGYALVPLKDFPGVFYANSSLPLERRKHDLILILTVLCAVIFVATLLAAFLIFRKVTYPLRSLAEQAEEISRQPAGRFLKPEGIRHSEFRKLTQAFNQVLSGLFEAQQELKKQTEKELAASEERYRDIHEAVPDAITVTTWKEGRYLEVNRAFCEITGYSVEEVIGKTTDDLELFVDPADRERLLKELTEKGEASGLDMQFRRKDGTRIETLASARRIRFGGQSCLIGVISDITELKKAQREKDRLERKLQQSQKMEAIGMLAGGVAHDLNNILSGLVSYPDLLLLGMPEDNPMRKPILTIQKSGLRAAAIVQDLLTLARRGVAATEVVNLNAILSDYLNSPEYENLKSYCSSLEMTADLESGLLNIYGSPVHLLKTVMNLVSNAIESMPEGGKMAISTENIYIDRPIQGYEDVIEGDYVALTVADTGTGISAEDMERIFEPFYTKKHMGRSGTGLGLSVVWGVVKDHKGYIDVQSIEGKGSTFKIYLPATREELAEKEEPSSDIYAAGKESILVVDDAEQQREIACGMLRKLGYEVSSVSSGEEAVKYMSGHSVDLLVLDMIMEPGMDGLDTYKEILKMHPGQKAVITSGFSETDRVREAEKLGAGAYIKKPYILEKIGLAVRTELEKPHQRV
jgi:PAS domain S-box-containing protein